MLARSLVKIWFTTLKNLSIEEEENGMANMWREMWYIAGKASLCFSQKNIEEKGILRGLPLIQSFNPRPPKSKELYFPVSLVLKKDVKCELAKESKSNSQFEFSLMFPTCYFSFSLCDVPWLLDYLLSPSLFIKSRHRRTDLSKYSSLVRGSGINWNFLIMGWRKPPAIRKLCTLTFTCKYSNAATKKNLEYIDGGALPLSVPL